MTTSKLRIYHTVSRRYRSVWHLSWYEFNEQHCPKNLSQFLSEYLTDFAVESIILRLFKSSTNTEFLEEMNSVRLASVSEVPPGHNCNPPVLIHCNEGERTGLTLVSDLLLYTLDHNQVILTYISFKIFQLTLGSACFEGHRYSTSYRPA